MSETFYGRAERRVPKPAHIAIDVIEMHMPFPTDVPVADVVGMVATAAAERFTDRAYIDMITDTVHEMAVSDRKPSFAPGKPSIIS